MQKSQSKYLLGGNKIGLSKLYFNILVRTMVTEVLNLSILNKKKCNIYQIIYQSQS